MLTCEFHKLGYLICGRLGDEGTPLLDGMKGLQWDPIIIEGIMWLASLTLGIPLGHDIKWCQGCKKENEFRISVSPTGIKMGPYESINGWLLLIEVLFSMVSILGASKSCDETELDPK